ncbi:hypothetical protein GCM10022222_85800 [Amycolatopsis ultiminotia]|uniref:PPE family protein n=1 Tax=Amycolatopsis ultiminotia TaxID=543629 RepID=A0ABP6YUF5_9PSEU
MGLFDWVGDGTKWLNDRFNEFEHWASDVWHGNTGDQAVPAPELVQKILASKGAQSWHQGAGQAEEMARQHHEASDDVRRLSTGLESMWTGGGADAAQAKIKPFADVTATAAQTYTGNGQNLTDLAHGFDEMKAALQPMPNTPPHKDFFDTASPWDTDTEDQINTYNKLAQENLDRYNGYSKQAQSSGQGLKTDYGQLEKFDGQVTITPQDPASSHTQHPSTGGTSGHTSARSEFTGTSGTAHTPPSAGTSGHTPAADYPVTAESPGANNQGDSGTKTSGYAPPSPPDTRTSPTPPLPVTGSGPGSGGGSSWSPGAGGGFVPGGFGGGGSSSGPDGAGAATGRGLAGGPGGGARSGVGAGEEGAVRGSGGAAAGRGASGARGGAGMGGMGAAGGKGKGEDDKEHQRKYGLDDDSAFSLTDDDDGRLVDPRTGLPPTPPTIGG